MSLLNNIPEFIVLSALIAVTAYVYTEILCDAGEILAFWKRWLDKVFQNDKRYCAGKEMHPVFKAMVECPKCVSGQLSNLYFILSAVYAGNYSLWYLPSHIMFVSLTIFFAYILTKTISKL